METISTNIIANLGAIGLIISGLVWFSKYMFVHFMNQQKQEAEEKRKLYDENNQKDSLFKDYLMLQIKESLEIIKANTEINNKLLRFFENSFTGYMQRRTKSDKQLSDTLGSFVQRIERIIKDGKA